MRLLRIRRLGFTLVELLVVIAIITVLIAIGLPVMNRAREKARQAACFGNLHNIGMALRIYRLEEGGYPGPYDPVTGWGGINALYPAYLDSRNAMICPDDDIDSGEAYRSQPAFAIRDSDGNVIGNLLDQVWRLYDPGTVPFDWLKSEFFSQNYSSYNLLYNWIGYIWWRPNPELPLPDRYVSDRMVVRTSGMGGLEVTQRVGWADNVAFWYEWFRWDPEDKIGDPIESYDWFRWVDQQLPNLLAMQVYWWDYQGPDTPDSAYRLQDVLRRPLWDPADVEWYPFGAYSPVFPGLINPNAPDNTIVTRCPHHRAYTKKVRLPKGTQPPQQEGRRGGRGGSAQVTYEKVRYGADIALRLDGSVELIPGPPQYEYNWATQPSL